MTGFLQIDSVSCGYGRKIILEGVNFSVQKGEILTIIGPNGAGKTTLLKTIPGLIPPLAGQISLNGKNIRNMSARDRAVNIAVVMQAMESIYMTVEEYVLLGRLPYFKNYRFFENKTDMNTALKYMEFTRILHLRDAPLGKISSGERQLATIAKALVQEPNLLLMDEPTSHLDIFHQARILDLIMKMKYQYGLTVVIVQHDLNLASEYSDKVVLINKEKKTVFQYGSPEKVITRDNIRAVYNTDVVVETNPHSGRPGIFIRNEIHPARSDML